MINLSKDTKIERISFSKLKEATEEEEEDKPYKHLFSPNSKELDHFKDKIKAL